MQIDSEVLTYAETVSRDDHTQREKRLCLDVIAHLCVEYDPRKPRRRAANTELKRRAEHHRGAIAPDDSMPPYDEWMRWSFVFYTGIKDIRSALLVEIDSEVKTYDELRDNDELLFEQHMCLSVLKNLCQSYGPQKVRRRLARDELKRRVDAELGRLGGAPEDANMPNYDTWMRWSRVSHGIRGARSSALKMIDAEVRKHDALTSAVGIKEAEIRICLNTILILCDRYNTEKVRRNAARVELRKRTREALKLLTEDDGIPSLDDWKRWSNSSGRRPSLIRDIDNELREYPSASPVLKPAIIKSKCDLYSMSSNPDARRLSACNELKRQIDAI
ncbi:MAG: hypothetical protein KAU35_03720 [candidate division Zixibacteria bacterium]|nr:hypothetical protein [candidate division Zixibacteria bacterium]